MQSVMCFLHTEFLLLSFDVELVKWQMQSPVQYPASFSWGLRGLHHFIGRVHQSTKGAHLSLEFWIGIFWDTTVIQNEDLMTA